MMDIEEYKTQLIANKWRARKLMGMGIPLLILTVIMCIISMQTHLYWGAILMAVCTGGTTACVAGLYMIIRETNQRLAELEA